MSDRLSLEQFAGMTPSIQQLMIDRGLAPVGVMAPGAQPPQSPAPVAAQQPAVPAAAQPPAQPPQSPAPAAQPPAPVAGLASLDEVPDQSRNGADFFPFAEFDCTGVLDQVQHRVGERCGPNYYAQFSIITVDESGMKAGIVPQSSRSTMWKYNMNTFGDQKDASNRSVARYKAFVRQVSGLPEGAKVDAQSAQLLADSARAPSLGRKVRIISTRGNERKNKPGTYFYDIVFIPLQ